MNFNDFISLIYVFLLWAVILGAFISGLKNLFR